MRGAAALLAVAAVLFACSEPKNKPKPLSEPGEKVYTLKGRVVSRDAGDNTVRVDHEAIPALMDGMTMDYSVRGADVAALPADGSRVEGKLHVTNNGYWLTDVKKVQS
jgi:Cu/Ag efflux protein CusF